jgi:predicted O-methyltransferase YrrM
VNSNLYETEASQYLPELDAFCDLIRAERATSFLEIGSKFGGTLWRVAQVLQPRSTIVAVDLPGGTVRWIESKPSLTDCCDSLRDIGHKVLIFWGDSTDPLLIDSVDRVRPFDVVLIDANHTMPYLRKDWHNYGMMGKIVAFHDIAWKSQPGQNQIDVPEFWDEIKGAYRHHEIKLDPTGQNNGIGVLWRDKYEGVT